MPAWPALSPRAVPGGFTFLGALPEREIQRIFLMHAFFGSRFKEQLIQILLGELTVITEAVHIKINVLHSAFRRIGMPSVDELLNQLHHWPDKGGRPRFKIRVRDP